MSINNVKLVKADTNKLLISFIIAALATLLLTIAMIIGKNVFASDRAQADSEIVLTQNFNTEESNNILLSTETIAYSSGASPWTISSGGNFSNKQELEAADARSLAISRQALESARTAAQQAQMWADAGVANPQGGSAPEGPAPLAPDNRYAPGFCTWYAYNRRYQLGKPIGNMWGNGGYWHVSAAAAGWSVDHSPQVGDVIDMPGHVAIVEAVGENNTVFISEMNARGLYSYSTRWISNATYYWFIH